MSKKSYEADALHYRPALEDEEAAANYVSKRNKKNKALQIVFDPQARRYARR